MASRQIGRERHNLNGRANGPSPSVSLRHLDQRTRSMRSEFLQESNLTDRLFRASNVHSLETLGLGAVFDERPPSPTKSIASNSTFSLTPAPSIASFTRSELEDELADVLRQHHIHERSVTPVPSDRSVPSDAAAPSSTTKVVQASSRIAGTHSSTSVSDAATPSLVRDSSSPGSSSPDSVSTTEGINELPDHIDLLEPDTTELRLQPEPYECPFWFLKCGFVGWNKDEWTDHTTAVHLDHKFPENAECPLLGCETVFSSSRVGEAWSQRMQHVAQHHEDGLTLKHSKADHELFRWLWNNRRIPTDIYQDLTVNHHLSHPFTHSVVFEGLAASRDQRLPRRRHQHVPRR